MTSRLVAVHILLITLSLLCGRLLAEPAKVVLAMDSSLSMRANDPKRDSLQGAELFCALLGSSDRLSVMTFSVDAETLLPAMPLSDPQAPQRISAAMQAIKMDGRRTNFEAALSAAYQHYLDDNSNTRARRILVLFSDGQLNLGSEAETGAARERIMRDLLPRIRDAGIHVYGVAFSAEADLDFLRTLSAETGGFSFEANTANDIYRAFLKLFEQTAQPLIARIRDGEVKIDSNVRSLSLVLPHGPDDAPIHLTDPSSRQLTAARGQPGVEWRSAPRFDHITIQEPAPGYWKVTGGEPDQRAYLESSLDLEIEVPQVVRAHQPIPISARLIDRHGPIDQRLSQGLHYTAKATQDSGGFAQLIELRPAAKAGEAKGELRLDRTGTYQVEVTTHSPRFERSKVVFMDVVPEGANLGKAPRPDSEPAGPAHQPKTLHRAIVIVLGANAALVLLIGLGIAFWRSRARRQQGEEEEPWVQGKSDDHI